MLSAGSGRDLPQQCEIPHAQHFEEGRRRGVQQGTSHGLTAADDVDETPLLEHAEHAIGSDTAEATDVTPETRVVAKATATIERLYWRKRPAAAISEPQPIRSCGLARVPKRPTTSEPAIPAAACVAISSA